MGIYVAAAAWAAVKQKEADQELKPPGALGPQRALHLPWIRALASFPGLGLSGDGNNSQGAGPGSAEPSSAARPIASGLCPCRRLPKSAISFWPLSIRPSGISVLTLYTLFEINLHSQSPGREKLIAFKMGVGTEPTS